MKTINGIIFDLDQTIVDTSPMETLRILRDWAAIYKNLSQTSLLPGVIEFWDLLMNRKIIIAVVSSAPKPYCERVLKHFGLNANIIIGYRETILHKPHPEPIILALEQMGIEADNCIAIGDTIEDYDAANRAGVESYVVFSNSTRQRQSLPSQSVMGSMYEVMAKLFPDK